MSVEAVPPPNRAARRKRRTRQALVDAALVFLSEGRPNVSIQEITDAADVGFGSFYNHFESKDQLFEAALVQVLQSYVEMRDIVAAGLEDPAEIFTVSYRMTGRLAHSHPELARVLLNTGTKALIHEAGLAPRARADIAAGVEAGRFHVDDVELAFMAAGSAMLGLMQLLQNSPDADAGSLTDGMALLVLRMLGVSKRDATRLCQRPLPAEPLP
jgi:AcrR family transcriptional regulator